MKTGELRLAQIIAIVEGDGEVEAVPALIRRIHAEVAPGVPLEVGRPVRVRRNRVLQDGELERYVGLAANLAGADGCILVLLDANGDCPANLGPDILQRASAPRSRAAAARRVLAHELRSLLGDHDGGAFVLPDVIRGMNEASMTRRPDTPRSPGTPSRRGSSRWQRAASMPGPPAAATRRPRPGSRRTARA